MNIISVLLLVIGIIYGGITILGITTQIKNKKINTWSSILMIAGALLIIISVILRIASRNNLLYLLITGLIFIHVSAISNGYKMYGKIHLIHHIIRFAISLCILILYIV